MGEPGSKHYFKYDTIPIKFLPVYIDNGSDIIDLL